MLIHSEEKFFLRGPYNSIRIFTFNNYLKKIRPCFIQFIPEFKTNEILAFLRKKP